MAVIFTNKMVIIMRAKPFFSSNRHINLWIIIYSYNKRVISWICPFLALLTTVRGAYQIPHFVRPSSVVVHRRCSSTILLDRNSSYSSQPIPTKLGTKLEPIGRQKMLGAEFWIFDLGWKKADDFVNFVDIDQFSKIYSNF